MQAASVKRSWTLQTQRSKCLQRVNSMPPKTAQAEQVPRDDDADSDASDEMSDPEDEIADDEATAAMEFDSVRDAARERVAPRTRTQYDLFMGLMKVYFCSQPGLSQFVKSGQCTLPLPIHAVAKYLDHVESKSREYVPGKFKPVSVSYYRTVCRSIHDFYICQQTPMIDELRLLLYSRTKAFARRIADLKASGEYPIGPSRCISSEGYSLLCNNLVQATPDEHGGWAWNLVACIWSYVVLLWCLLARCDRVAQLRWEDFSWTNDALTVFISKSKSDQSGDRAYHKKLFTSDKPATCPVLAVGVLFFGRNETRSEFIFPRADTRRAGLRQLSRLMHAAFTESQYALFGCNPLNIAWHHLKRGGMTYLSSKMDGPSHIAVKMRADQTIMDVSRHYIMQSAGQDGYIGRLLSLLPYGEQRFAQQEYALPPTTSVQWPSIVADYSELPVHFRYEVVPKLFATVCKHQDWLRENLPRGHPLLASELFTVHDSLLRGAQPHVHELTRPMGQCSGLPLSLQTHLLIRQTMQAAIPAPCTPHPPPVYLSDVAMSLPADLSMRALRPLPKSYHLTKLSIVALWRAWWCDVSTEPMPLRMMEGKFPSGPDYAADRTRYTRYKTVVKTIQSEMPADACVAQTSLAFSRGWRSLASYLKSHHGIDCDPESAPSTLYSHIVALPAFAPPVIRSVQTRFATSSRPLEEVLHEHMESLKGSEASGAAACIRKELQADLHRDPRYGHLHTNEHWPAPKNPWVQGAVQCAKCVSCEKYFAKYKCIRSHLLGHMTSEEREKHFRADGSGSWIYTAPSTKWCVSVTLPNTLRPRFVPVTKGLTLTNRKDAPQPEIPVSALSAIASITPSSSSSAMPIVSATASHMLEHAQVPALQTCCCGSTFRDVYTLRRHHNGAPQGKRPREPSHACTTANCTI